MSPPYLRKTDKGCLRQSRMERVIKLDWVSDWLGKGTVPEKLFLTSSLDYSDVATHTAGLQTDQYHLGCASVGPSHRNLSSVSCSATTASIYFRALLKSHLLEKYFTNQTSALKGKVMCMSVSVCECRYL